MIQLSLNDCLTRSYTDGFPAIPFNPYFNLNTFILEHLFRFGGTALFLN